MLSGMEQVEREFKFEVDQLPEGLLQGVLRSIEDPDKIVNAREPFGLF
jgi:hypothetical protein